MANHYAYACWRSILYLHFQNNVTYHATKVYRINRQHNLNSLITRFVYDHKDNFYIYTSLFIGIWKREKFYVLILHISNLYHHDKLEKFLNILFLFFSIPIYTMENLCDINRLIQQLTWLNFVPGCSSTTYFVVRVKGKLLENTNFSIQTSRWWLICTSQL